jgi:hypothetical protein
VVLTQKIRHYRQRTLTNRIMYEDTRNNLPNTSVFQDLYTICVTYLRVLQGSGEGNRTCILCPLLPYKVYNPPFHERNDQSVSVTAGCTELRPENTFCFAVPMHKPCRNESSQNHYCVMQTPSKPMRTITHVCLPTWDMKHTTNSALFVSTRSITGLNTAKCREGKKQ